MPRSASPFSTSTGFWVPPPGITLMLSPAFSRSSSAMPPEMAYQPPPTAPAVHVSEAWAAAAPAVAAMRARARSRAGARFDIDGSPWSAARTAVRLEHVGLGAQVAGAEAVEGQGVNIHAAGAAVKHQFGHEDADGRGVHEAVPGEAAGDVEAGRLGDRPEDAVVVGRQVAHARVGPHH